MQIGFMSELVRIDQANQPAGQPNHGSAWQVGGQSRASAGNSDVGGIANKPHLGHSMEQSTPREHQPLHIGHFP